MIGEGLKADATCSAGNPAEAGRHDSLKAKAARSAEGPKNRDKIRSDAAVVSR